MVREIIKKSASSVNGLELIREGGIEYCYATYNGEKKKLSDWAKEVGLPRHVLYNRIVLRGWTIEKAMTEPTQKNEKHGKSRTPEFHVWQLMWRRCSVESDSAYKNYGGRGIKVCEEWRLFSSFYRDMGSRPSSSHTIERIDNDKGYEASNCRWATRAEQGRNNRRNVVIEFNGQKKVLTDWAAEVGLTVTALWKRLFKGGWTVEKALTTPKTKR